MTIEELKLAYEYCGGAYILIVVGIVVAHTISLAIIVGGYVVRKVRGRPV